MKALELASNIEEVNKALRREMSIFVPEFDETAAELRRLAEVNAELLEALETAVNVMNIQRDIVERGQHSSAWDHPINFAKAAIAKAKEQQ